MSGSAGVIGEIVARVFASNLDGVDLDRLSVDECCFLPGKNSLGHGIEDHMEHRAKFTGGMNELELVGLHVTAFAVEHHGGARLVMVDVFHQFDEGVFVAPVAIARGIDGLVGDLVAIEVNQ